MTLSHQLPNKSRHLHRNHPAYKRLRATIEGPGAGFPNFVDAIAPPPPPIADSPPHGLARGPETAMAMLNQDEPMRDSLQVAPLAIQKGYGGSPDDGLYHDAYTATADVYSHSHMTPPATPSTAEDDPSTYEAHHAPPVFYNFIRAFYPFHPDYAITDSSVTLPLNEGDVILVHSIHTNGWADGTLLVTGARGWLPTNYCESYEPEEMRNLLKALLNFWDLLRSTSISDSEIFGNQEFMKGIIAGVRYLLVRCDYL